MSPKKREKYGNPANRPRSYGGLFDARQPNGNADPRAFGNASISGPGGAHDRDAVVIDMTDVILLGGADVAVVEIGRHGVLDGQMAYLQMHGRVNKTANEVSVGFVFDTDGAAALITELLALSFRDSADMLDDVTRRLTELHRGKNVDLHWLRAAIDNAIDSE